MAKFNSFKVEYPVATSPNTCTFFALRDLGYAAVLAAINFPDGTERGAVWRGAERFREVIDGIKTSRDFDVDAYAVASGLAERLTAQQLRPPKILIPEARAVGAVVIGSHRIQPEGRKYMLWPPGFSTWSAGPVVITRHTGVDGQATNITCGDPFNYSGDIIQKPGVTTTVSIGVGPEAADGIAPPHSATISFETIPDLHWTAADLRAPTAAQLL